MATLSSQIATKGVLTLVIVIPPEEIVEPLARAARDLQREHPLSGFRPGKASIEQAKRAFGEMALLERAVRFAVPAAYLAIISKEHLPTIGEPDIQVTKLVPGEPIEFTAAVAVLPKVTLGDYRSIREPFKPTAVEDKAVDTVIDELRDLRAEEKPVDKAATLSDTVLTDLTMSRDGVVLEGGQAKGHKIDLTQPYVIPGFKEQLVGMKKGETKEFSLPFPEEHHDKLLAGKTITYKATITGVFEKVRPEVTDAFAASVGNFATIAALREQIKMNVQEMENSKEQQRFERAIIDALIKQSTFGEIPDLLIEAELRKILARVQGQVAAQGLEWSSYLEHLGKNVEELQKAWVPEAIIRVQAALLVRVIAEEEQLTVSEEEKEAERKLILEHYNKPEEEDIREEVRSVEYDSHLKHLILTRKVMEFMTTIAKQS
ncbi:MAG: trigger factor [Patescibacteria group bacterium]|jgi:trigger factor